MQPVHRSGNSWKELCGLSRPGKRSVGPIGALAMPLSARGPS